MMEPTTYATVTAHGDRIEHKKGEVVRPENRPVTATAESIQVRALPSLFQQAKNLMGSVYHHLRTGSHYVSEEVAEERLAICAPCLRPDKRCPACGCYMPIKATWKNEKCKLGKW